MNAKELLKKYWFVALIALALTAFVVMYSVDAYKNRDITVKNKQIDGKYVAYTIDGEPVYADDLYNSLYAYQNNGASQVMVNYERQVFNTAYETTDEMKNRAAISVANIINSYSKDYLDKYLRSVGYSQGFEEMDKYYIDSMKQELLIKEYVLAHQDELLSDLGTNPRLIYHILVRCETSEVTDEQGNVIAYEANPTDEQKAKLDEILEALKAEDSSFEYTAYTYSDDGSKERGGYIGLINEENSTMYDQMFAKAALELKDGEVSEPIVSQFGYHIIKNAGTSADKLLDDYYYLADMQSSNPTLALKATLEKGKELGFEIKSEELINYYNSIMESEEN